VTGLVRVADAALQIMGQAGDMQVSGVNNALATAAGGSTQFFAVTLLSNEPRQSGQA
jgi:acetyl-CoA C-acetyltransferase